jgi:hypothetical protein
MDVTWWYFLGLLGRLLLKRLLTLFALSDDGESLWITDLLDFADFLFNPNPNSFQHH